MRNTLEKLNLNLLSELQAINFFSGLSIFASTIVMNQGEKKRKKKSQKYILLLVKIV